MNKRLTQTEAKEAWLKLLHGDTPPTRKAIDEIDAMTPWSETEPQWWLDMMHYRRTCEN